VRGRGGEGGGFAVVWRGEDNTSDASQSTFVCSIPVLLFSYNSRHGNSSLDQNYSINSTY